MLRRAWHFSCAALFLFLFPFSRADGNNLARARDITSRLETGQRPPHIRRRSNNVRTRFTHPSFPSVLRDANAWVDRARCCQTSGRVWIVCCLNNDRGRAIRGRWSTLRPRVFCHGIIRCASLLLLMFASRLPPALARVPYFTRTILPSFHPHTCTRLFFPLPRISVSHPHHTYQRLSANARPGCRSSALGQ